MSGGRGGSVYWSSVLIKAVFKYYFPSGRKGIICTAVGDIAAGNAIFAASKGSLGVVSLLISTKFRSN